LPAEMVAVFCKKLQQTTLHRSAWKPVECKQAIATDMALDGRSVNGFMGVFTKIIERRFADPYDMTFECSVVTHTANLSPGAVLLHDRNQ